MSHTVQIKTEFKNRTALEAALTKLGWKLKENTKLRTYPYDPDRDKVYALAAINPMSNGYDVGLKIAETGEIDLLCDFYGGSIAKSLGTDFAILKKEYVIKVVEQEYEDVQILEMLADGSIILEADDGY